MLEMEISPKQLAGEYAVRYVKSGMTVGLGTGSTVYFTLHKLGQYLREGRLRDLVGVPTSVQTERLAAQFGIPLTTLEEHESIDVTIDGADEVDPELNLIKGLGGALVREKIVATVSKRLVIVVDESKRVQQLGTRAPLPVEVVPFGWRTVLSYVRTLGGDPVLRLDAGGKPYLTDNGNLILDCRFPGITDPAELEQRLNNRAGVVENGLFLGLTSVVIWAGKEGVQVLTKGQDPVPAAI